MAEFKMAEFKMPIYKFKGDSLSLDECYRELSSMTYQSPVNLIRQGVETKIEGDIFEAILNYGISVDKDELIKALQYDRNQYEQGFIDGCRHDTDTLKREVAREIFAELDKVIKEHKDGFYCDWYMHERYAKLKKKYTEENR